MVGGETEQAHSPIPVQHTRYVSVASAVAPLSNCRQIFRRHIGHLIPLATLTVLSATLTQNPRVGPSPSPPLHLAAEKRTQTRTDFETDKTSKNNIKNPRTSPSTTRPRRPIRPPSSWLGCLAADARYRESSSLLPFLQFHFPSHSSRSRTNRKAVRPLNLD